MAAREKAMHPDELGKFFMERAKSRDVEGIVALYEENAILDLPSGGSHRRHEHTHILRKAIGEQAKFSR